ncbi:hypothetical protein [Paenibacillus herberti]|uniref:Uncharacterized protein n=1 Tax=Paenibacillus herberti TaxID=1619309 RepID=A0A229P2X9_9BACL|nr:hypothetical protein [Paenibacillus herberti]OXM16592.1 hypothetical protein CGZ75_08000 [Paenibacillus herberti]
MKTVKKKIVSGMITFGILSLTSITAFAATEPLTYTSYALPTFKGNNYTGSHQKQTADEFITNKVTDITGTSTATFWAANGIKEQISNDYDQKKNNVSKIQFRNSVSKGGDVIMGMQNANLNILDSGFVSGEVDFR